MNGRVLITGGAGFIGSHAADELLAHGYTVRLLDSLEPQVHGPARQAPDYLDPRCELLVGDIRDIDAVRQALRDVDYVLHLASADGVGQSMYEIERYTSVNTYGTGVLLQALTERPVKRLVLASSMSIYGEGLYCDASGRMVEDAKRSTPDLELGRWELRTPEGRPLDPLPTPEGKRPALSSVYALGKYGQERLCLMVGKAHRIPTTALRLFNVYGPRQALSNPYAGVLAIFAARYLNDRAPLVYEDGRQLRDFVSVHDVTRAFRLALESPTAPGEVLNIGSGRAFTVAHVAERLAAALGKAHIRPVLTGKYRVGDVRHCFADISRARAVLGYRAQVPFEEGLKAFAAHLAGQVAEDHADAAHAELVSRGLEV